MSDQSQLEFYFQKISELKSNPPESLEEYQAVVAKTALLIDAEKITDQFYTDMFTNYPQLKSYFNQSHQRQGDQPRALANSVCAYATNLDNLEVLGPAVVRIAEKHCAFHIQPEQYPIVGANLLGAIKKTHDVNDEVLDSWGKSYGDLANIFIAVEENIYKQHANAVGGWIGFKEWSVVRKEKEADNVTSIYLTCDDPVPPYNPGNYITMKNPFFHEDGFAVAPRNYSLSDWSSEHLRITVKKELSPETGIPDGISSTWVNEQLEVGEKVSLSFPAGDFYVSKEVIDSGDDIVLAAGGVGITAIFCMFKYLASIGHTGKVTLIYGVKSKSDQPLRREIDEIVQSHDNFSLHSFYSQEQVEPSATEFSGRFSESLWNDITTCDPSKTSVYLCGPLGFIKTCAHAALHAGIPKEKVYYEYFNTNLGNLMS